MTNSAQATRSGRRPGNPDTRQQILDSARDIFAANGFARASIRKIAAAAGVDPALVHHYFGSKDDLFLATVEVQVNPRVILEQVAAGGVEGLGERMITAILSVWESPAGASLIAAVRTAIGDPNSGRAFSQFITAEVISRLLHSLDYEPAEAEQRGALIASQIIGIVIGRYVLAVGSLARLDRRAIIASVGATLQHYLTGELPRI